MKFSYTVRPVVLGIFPTSHGIGWAAFDGPFSVVGHGSHTVIRDKNRICLRKVEKLLGAYKPDLVVLEAFERPAMRHARIQRLCRSISALTEGRGHGLSVFPRSQVRAAFASSGALTREEVAKQVAIRVPMLEALLPKPRRFDDGICKRMAMFNAAALVLTHYYFSSNDLLDDLKGAA